MAPNATDMISQITALMYKEATLEDVLSYVHPHPTFEEAIKEAVASEIIK